MLSTKAKQKIKVAVLSFSLALVILEGGSFLLYSLLADSSAKTITTEFTHLSKVVTAHRYASTSDIQIPYKQLSSNIDQIPDDPRYFLYISKHLRVKLNDDPADQESIKPDTYKIVITGNSTAMGLGASTNSKTFAAQLQRLLREKYGDSVQVINYSTSDYRFIDEIFIYLTKAQFISPKIWIVFNGDNDFSKVDHTQTVEEALYTGRKAISKMLITRRLPFKLLPNFQRLLLALDYKFFDKAVADRFAETADTFSYQNDSSVYLSNLNAAINLAAGGNTELFHVIQPALGLDQHSPTSDESSLAMGNREQIYLHKFYEKIKSELRPEKMKKNFPHYHYLNGDVFFEKFTDENMYEDTRHYTDIGHRIIAEKLFAAIDPTVRKKLNPIKQ